MDRRTFLRAGSFLPAALFCFSQSTAMTRAVGRISLNFDDGPEPAVLKELLPLLSKYAVPATFFVIGELAAAHRHVLPTLATFGHEVENHGYSHVKFTKLLQNKGPEGVKNSLARTADTIVQGTGVRPRYFRPPFWDYNKELEQVVMSAGYRMMKIGDPDINSLDYDDVANRRPHSALVQRVQKQVAERTARGIYNFVFVVHERALTVAALAELIPKLQSDGYVFSRLDKINL